MTGLNREFAKKGKPSAIARRSTAADRQYEIKGIQRGDTQLKVTVKGPVAVMITTTAAELEGETASRFLYLTIDESAQMTEAIRRMQRQAETLEGLVKKKRAEHIVKKHHPAQRLLKPLAVVNPFTEYLSYPNRSIRTRRYHKKYLG